MYGTKWEKEMKLKSKEFLVDFIRNLLIHIGRPEQNQSAKVPPSFIYLQLDGDGGDEYIENAATWCEDRIYNVSVYAMFFARFLIILSKNKGKKYGRATAGANHIYCVM